MKLAVVVVLAVVYYYYSGSGPEIVSSSSSSSLLLFVSALEYCSDDRGGGVCPSGNTCCPGVVDVTARSSAATIPLSSSSSSYCIPNDLGSYNATCCLDDDDYGCAVGYICAVYADHNYNNNNNQNDGGYYYCLAGDTITDPLVQRLPRYRLCRSTDALRHVYGFPIMTGGQPPQPQKQHRHNNEEKDDDLKLAYYSSHGGITTLNEIQRMQINTVAIAIHGAGRNADDYFCSLTAAATSYLRDQAKNKKKKRQDPTGRQDNGEDPDDLSTILILAPRFPVATDTDLVLEGGGTALVWSDDTDLNQPWRYGAHAINPPPPSMKPPYIEMSSFAVLDQMVNLLLNQSIATGFPNVESITIVGHSAGGQFVQRWSLLSPVVWDDSFRIRSVVMNPSSYAYLTPLRYYKNQWQIPPLEDCPEYNQWEWGLEAGPKLNAIPYIRNILDRYTVHDLIERFHLVDVTYMIGSLDHCNVSEYDTNGWCYSHGLQTQCGDMVQGSHRLERHSSYLAMLRRLGIVYTNRIVPGVGHDHSLMFNSPIGIDAIFGNHNNNNNKVAESVPL